MSSLQSGLRAKALARSSVIKDFCDPLSKSRLAFVRFSPLVTVVIAVFKRHTLFCDVGMVIDIKAVSVVPLLVFVAAAVAGWLGGVLLLC